ncbi:hypothetical protein P8452_73365 [Trifolium repens]|nr:hypothetical protein P8452_73365 [Trifolium repens]
MAPFLLFAFVFASQVIGGFNTKLPSPSYGNTITILSIDGGAIKGIVPSVVLSHLENSLKEVSKDEKAALADYFDVIAGTSTGGLIAAMLAAPSLSDPFRPAFTAEEILQFYLEFGPSIFNQTEAKGWNPLLSKRPRFSGKFLHDKAREILGETRLSDALTNLIIPTFDIKKLHPIIFSTFKLDDVPSLDVKLSDISIGTSAAPSVLPPYFFQDGDNEFNLVDGGLAAGSPSLVAVSEVAQEWNEKNPNEPLKVVLLSLGCGREVTKGGPNATEAGSLTFVAGWLPLLAESLGSAAADINEYHLASVFPDLPSSHNYYLRVEEYNLDPTIGQVNSTQENMDKLVKVGEALLNQTVKIQNVTSFVPYEKPSKGTNGQALERLAKILYNEKQYRLKMKSVKKGGRPFIE